MFISETVEMSTVNVNILPWKKKLIYPHSNSPKCDTGLFFGAAAAYYAFNPYYNVVITNQYKCFHCTSSTRTEFPVKTAACPSCRCLLNRCLAPETTALLCTDKCGPLFKLAPCAQPETALQLSKPAVNTPIITNVSHDSVSWFFLHFFSFHVLSFASRLLNVKTTVSLIGCQTQKQMEISQNNGMN